MSKPVAKYITKKDLINILPKSGTYLIPHAASIPTTILEWISKNISNFENITLINMNPKGNIFMADNKYKNITLKTFFLSPFNHDRFQDLYSEFIPMHFSETPLFIKNTPIDIYITPVSPTFNNKVSLGISVDYEKAAMENAKLKIAIQSTNVPYTYGDSEYLLNKFDYILIDNNLKLAEIPINNIKNEIIDAIAKHATELIPDGATLQAGVGKIPDAILNNLINKKDLGIHSEMMSESMMKLLLNGNITNKKKTIDKNYCVTTFAYGTKKLYKFLDKNKRIKFKTVDYVNDSYNIGKNDNAISINSAIQVDLTGQINAEVLKKSQISGVGGQVDFVRGAKLSKGGKSIIAFPSTNSAGDISRIVPVLDQQATVTTTRNDVDYVCTEYGCVQLRGKSLYERKKLITSLAHPKFRKVLGKTS